jgi:hypothetical protein
MKKYLIAALVPLLLMACSRPDKPAKPMALDVVLPAKNYAVPSQKAVRQVKFPPPVAAADAEVAEKPEAKMDESTSDNSIVKDTSKKIIKEGDISFEAKDIVATRKQLITELYKLGGYLDEDNETLNSDDNRKEYVLKTRIPAKNFDVFLDSVSNGAEKIDSKHISISDVTTQFIDMTTRLHNQKILEATYINLLKRASKMSDVLEVEDKLTDTRTEIESEQGQLNYLDKQIAYSSLDITFYTKQIQRETGTGSGYKFKSSLTVGWELVQDLFFGIISLWPIIILLTVIIILIKRWRKKRRLAKQ